MEQGYALLRSKGFRVATSTPFIVSNEENFVISKTIPAAGTHVARGSVVILVPEATGSGSPVGVIHPKHYRLPDFVGRSLPDATRWLDRHPVEYWYVPSVPRLDGSTAPSLFAAYVVTAQRPAVGKRLSENGRFRLTVRPRR